MTLESILYLAFGFLIAIFLALILIPAIWNRAVYLTEVKVRGSLPYNSREVEAEKDTMRAEHAMTVRRLELAIGELREKATSHIAELHGKRDENNRLKSTTNVTRENMTNLEKAAEQMRGKIADLHERNTSLSEELHSNIDAYEKLKKEHEDLLSSHSKNSEELNRSRVDLIAKDGRIESLSATLGTMNLSDNDQAAKVTSLSDEIVALKKKLSEEQKLAKRLQKNNDALAKQLSKASSEIETSDQETSEELANTRKELEDRILALGEELMQERTRSIELEAELARRALNLEIERSDHEQTETIENGPSLEELENLGESINSSLKAVKNAKPSSDEKEKLRESIRTLGEKAARLNSPRAQI